MSKQIIKLAISNTKTVNKTKVNHIQSINRQFHFRLDFSLVSSIYEINCGTIIINCVLTSTDNIDKNEIFSVERLITNDILEKFVINSEKLCFPVVGNLYGVSYF